MNAEKTSAVRVWDLPTRLFHWALVVLIALQFATAEFGWLSMEWHYRCGYATLALVGFRILWGFAGSQTSRFVDFVRGPTSLVRYAQTLLPGKVDKSQNIQRRIGHNALGGWSVLIMLACLLAQAITGLFSSDGIDADGPFSDSVAPATVKFVTHLHHLGETVLLGLIALHVLAVLLHWLLKHDNLIVPMITGRKRLPQDPALFFASGWRALLLLAIAALAVFALSRLGSA